MTRMSSSFACSFCRFFCRWISCEMSVSAGGVCVRGLHVFVHVCVCVRVCAWACYSCTLCVHVRVRDDSNTTYIVALCDLVHERPLGLPLPLQVLHVLLLQSLQVAQHGLRLLVLALRLQQLVLFPLFNLVLDHLRTSVGRWV